jgi:MraZ protein
MAQPGTPFYTDHFTHTLDDKGRLTIPAAWRYAHEESDTFLATPHPDGYIAVLPPAEAAKLREKIAAIKYGDAAGQRWAARFSKESQAFSFDHAGRAALKPDLLKHAGITKEAVLVGSMTKFNIYNAARWQREEHGPESESVGDVMRRLDI